MIRTYAMTAGLLGASILTPAMPPSADAQLNPAAYPELSTETLLPAILAELRHTLPDIYPVRELRLCKPEKIKLKDGRPSSWSVRMEFNTRNEAAGYTGVRRYVAIFKNGRIAYPIGTADFIGRDGINGFLNRMIDKQMAGCAWVKDADIQAALTSAGG